MQHHPNKLKHSKFYVLHFLLNMYLNKFSCIEHVFEQVPNICTYMLLDIIDPEMILEFKRCYFEKGLKL